MMYSAATVALLASMINTASAHYFFDKLVINGQGSTDFVRQNTRPTKYMPTKFINSFDNITPESTDFRCNMGATNTGSKATANVKAGDSLAMSLGVGATMQHPGPGQVYMSKAPGSVSTYDGSGDWFKIHQETVCKQGADIKKEAWCTWDKDRISFKIPQGIPDGEYLIRTEHIGLHGAHDGQAEFYYGCAQVKVTGGTGTTVPAGVKIPGVYKKADPEVNFSVWGGNNVVYPAKGPGPAVATFDAASSTPVTETTPASGSESSGSVPSGSVPSKPSGTAPSKPSGTAPSGTTPSAPAQQSAAPSADPTKCGMYARRHARDMAN